MSRFACVSCGFPYPEDELPYLCPHCGQLFDLLDLQYHPEAIDDKLGGIWKYWHDFGLLSETPIVSLGEGNTPLVWDQDNGDPIAFKLEYLNPTGSYKDRGSAVLVSHLLARGIPLAVEDSSGNAGASFATYAARAGIHARIFVPEAASGPKRAQIEVVGAELIKVPGPRREAARAVRAAAAEGIPYASHAYLPFGMTGIATLAFEIYEQMRSMPGTIIAPVGHGSLLLGIIRGFKAIQETEGIDRLPVFVGVQAAACAPVARKFRGNPAIQEAAPKSLAEGVLVQNPARGDAILKAFNRKEDEIVAVDEPAILLVWNELARRGFYVEPTSALVWAAYRSGKGKYPGPVVMILTGSGFKFNE